MIKPFSDNLVFMDAEFSSIDPSKGEIISIAFIKPTGEELYLEIAYDSSTLDDWVKEHVVPKLSGAALPKAEAKQRIDEFLGQDHPYVVSHINHFDVTFFWRTFGLPAKLPTYDYWFPLDFATLLFFSGIDPRHYGREHKTDAHSALADAQRLKDSYEQLLGEQGA